jgi:hypothetical protein
MMNLLSDSNKKLPPLAGFSSARDVHEANRQEMFECIRRVACEMNGQKQSERRHQNA